MGWIAGKNSGLFANGAQVRIWLGAHLSNKFNLFRRQLGSLYEVCPLTSEEGQSL